MPLRTPARAPAGHAAVAGSAAHHQRTADIAGGRVSHLDKFPERTYWIRAIGIPRWLNGHRNDLEQFALVNSDEFQLQPAEDVIDDRFRIGQLRLAASRR